VFSYRKERRSKACKPRIWPACQSLGRGRKPRRFGFGPRAGVCERQALAQRGEARYVSCQEARRLPIAGVDAGACCDGSMRCSLHAARQAGVEMRPVVP
jgi:hypothetical protein